MHFVLVALSLDFEGRRRSKRQLFAGVVAFAEPRRAKQLLAGQATADCEPLLTDHRERLKGV